PKRKVVNEGARRPVITLDLTRYADHVEIAVWPELHPPRIRYRGEVVEESARSAVVALHTIGAITDHVKIAVRPEEQSPNLGGIESPTAGSDEVPEKDPSLGIKALDTVLGSIADKQLDSLCCRHGDDAKTTKRESNQGKSKAVAGGMCHDCSPL